MMENNEHEQEFTDYVFKNESDYDAEAVAQCNILRDKLIEAVKERNMIVKALRDKLSVTEEMADKQRIMQDIQRTNEPVTRILEEYNLWTERTGEEKLEID